MSDTGAPVRWLVVELARPEGDEAAGLLIDDLTLLDIGGVEEGGDWLRVYLPDEGSAPSEPSGLLEELRAIAGAIELRHWWQEHEDWSEIWRAGLGPRRITSRIVVSPTWDDPKLLEGDLSIRLDPGMAFGTAEHPTTRACLRLLDSLVRSGDRIADIGAGSGILSIAAVLLGADHVTAVEMDSWSCNTARENVQQNHVEDRIEVIEAKLGADGLPGRAPMDGIVGNIEPKVLIELLPGFRAAVVSNGWLVLSGIQEWDAAIVTAAATALGFELETVDEEEDWWSGAFRAVPTGR